MEVGLDCVGRCMDVLECVGMCFVGVFMKLSGCVNESRVRAC